MLPEKHKRPGVCYALSDEGWELPVIDVTHPAFELHPTRDELAATSAMSLQALQRSLKLPAFLRNFMAGRMLLTRDFAKTYVGGVTCYLQKLGSDNLGRGYAKPIDRLIATRIGPLSMRLRLQALAHLLADSLVPLLQSRPAAPLHLVNIAGGTATDSLNALLVLRREHPAELLERPVWIHLLDLDPHAMNFAARALDALQGSGAPLFGLDLRLNPVLYDWLDVYPLRELLKQINANDAIIAASSEGGLFEYGSDSEIVTNLKTLHQCTPDDTVIVGSVLRDAATADPSLAIMNSMTSNMTFRLLGLDAFRKLLSSTGWRLERALEDNPFYFLVGLQKG